MYLVFLLVTNSSDILPIILPTFEGLPISNTWYADMAPVVRVMGEEGDPITTGQVNMQRWFLLMHLAADPTLLDNNRSAAVLVLANIPGPKWQEYFNCGGRDPDCELLARAAKGVIVSALCRHCQLPCLSGGEGARRQRFGFTEHGRYQSRDGLRGNTAFCREHCRRD